VREAHARAGQDQDAADSPRRRLLALGLGIERGVAHHELQDQQQDGRTHEADHRRQQQRVADLGRLASVDSRCAGGATGPGQISVAALVHQIMALMPRTTAEALAWRSADWFRYCSWRVDLVERRIGDAGEAV
jgi:hypothetical protein